MTRQPRPLYLMAAMALLVTPAAAAATVYVTHLRQEDACDNRAAIVEAFDIFTDVLVSASDRPDDRTAEEQKQYEATVAQFRGDLARRLAPLEEGC